MLFKINGTKASYKQKNNPCHRYRWQGLFLAKAETQNMNCICFIGGNKRYKTLFAAMFYSDIIVSSSPATALKTV